jgi:uncharacterized membrane protein YdcZ (DUF606 family)
MVSGVLGTALLAVIVTKLVDLARKFDPDNKAPKMIWIALSMVFGLAIALIWQVDGLAELGVTSTTRLQGVSGQILTGLLVGGFGSGWHEVFDALSSSAKGARAVAAKTSDMPPNEIKREVWGGSRG